MVNPEEFVDREKLSSALAHDVATAAVEAFQSILARTGYRLVSIEIEACEAPQYLRPKKPTEFELDERVACKDAKGAAGRPPKQPPRRPPKQDEGDPGQQAGRPAKEKPKAGDAWVNGGFFVLEPDIFKYIHDDSTSWEGDSLQQLAQEDNLKAFEHNGFWHAMDTLRDKNHLEDLWASGKAPWKVW